jgi:glutaredoxin
MATMKQECPLAFVWLTWLGIPALAVLVGVYSGWPYAVLTLLVGVVVELGYIRAFPRLSRMMGYGSVADTPARAGPALPGHLKVTLHTANVCPFCPIVRERLSALRQRLGFELEEVDVTFRPELVRKQGIRSVPVVRAGDAILVGNATSAELVSFLAGAAAQLPGT